MKALEVASALHVCVHTHIHTPIHICIKVSVGRVWALSPLAILLELVFTEQGFLRIGWKYALQLVTCQED